MRVICSLWTLVKRKQSGITGSRSVPDDVEVFRILVRGLLGGGYEPAGQEAYDVLWPKDMRNALSGWTRERWQAAKGEALGQNR